MSFIGKAKTKGNEAKLVSNNAQVMDELQTIREALANLGGVAGDQAKVVGRQAQVLGKEGLEWAQPRVRQLLDEAQSTKEDVQEKGKKKGKKLSRKARKQKEQAQKDAEKRRKELQKEAEKRRKEARESVEQSRKKLEEDYIPRVQRAWSNANELAHRDLPLSLKAQAIGQSAQHALTEPTPERKAKKGGKVATWLVVGALIVGAGYLVWRRTQPTEDPWAEEYWDDASTPTAPTTEGNVKNENQQDEVTRSGTTGTTPGSPAADGDSAAKDTIVTEEKVQDTTAGDRPTDGVIGNTDDNDGRKLGEL